MLLYLDIDGVMVPANAWRKPEILEDGFPAFSSNAVRSLDRIISSSSANIVLTVLRSPPMTAAALDFPVPNL
jgi:hypothetical protein